MICLMSIKHAKFFCSSFKSQLFPYVPACKYTFYALAIYVHPTFTAPFLSEAHFESGRTAAVELNLL